MKEIINYNMTIEIIGTWIWCFDAYLYRGRLRELGFTWCRKKKAWVWHAEEYIRPYRNEIPLSHIREKYGTEVIRNYVPSWKLNRKTGT